MTRFVHFSLVLSAACALCAGGVVVGQQVSTPGATQAAESASRAERAAPQIASLEVVLRGKDGAVEATYRGRLVEPPANAIADPGATVPLVVFLHGAGERGDDNAAQLKHFAGACAEPAFQAKHPCYLLAMQCPADETWMALARELKYGKDGKFATHRDEPTRAMRAVMQAIDEVLATKAVDRTRVYLTGLSMGGFGSFDLAARRPGLFAAVVPICGGGDPATAKRVAATPFYIVHGSDDSVVPVENSRRMRDAILAAYAEHTKREREKARGTPDDPRPMPKFAPNPMYREYEKVGHDSWTPAYRFGDDGVLDWMFAQRRATPGTAAPDARDAANTRK